jgi:hypothetical protein
MSDVTSISDALSVLDEALISFHGTKNAPGVDALLAELDQRAAMARAIRSTMAPA